MTKKKKGELLRIVLLLALPASGKSELRKYLRSLSATVCRRDFHLGDTVQLDDYPYVEFMRFIDGVAVKLGLGYIFFRDADQPFADPYEWGTLIELLNEDYRYLMEPKIVVAPSPARFLFRYIDRAERRAGARIKLGRLPEDVLDALARYVDDQARKILNDKIGAHPDSLKGKTIVMEFARGGARGAAMPLDPPYGYEWSLSRLDPEILRQATILYVKVTPEESRRKNFERAIPPPDKKDTGIFHGVPTSVMLNDYGCDDIQYLKDESGFFSTIQITTHGETFTIPIAEFDNDRDRTSFLRADQDQWKPDDVRNVHGELMAAMKQLC